MSTPGDYADDCETCRGLIDGAAPARLRTPAVEVRHSGRGTLLAEYLCQACRTWWWNEFPPPGGGQSGVRQAARHRVGAAGARHPG